MKFICPNAVLIWVPTRWWQLNFSYYKIWKSWRSTPRLNSSQLSTCAGNCHFTYDYELLFHSFHISCTFFKLPSPIFDIFKSARTQTIFSKKHNYTCTFSNELKCILNHQWIHGSIGPRKKYILMNKKKYSHSYRY